MSIKTLKFLKISCIHFLPILLLAKNACGGGREDREEDNHFAVVNCMQWQYKNGDTFFLPVLQRIVLVKMSKTPKGLPCAEWTMPSVCVRSDLVCINCYLGGKIRSLSALLSTAVLVATVTPEGISCMID